MFPFRRPVGIVSTQPGYTPYHVAALTAGTALKTGSGVLHAVVINTRGATGNLLTLYDGASTAGSVLAVIDTTAAVGSLRFDAAFLVGLFAVLAVGTAADLTIAAA
ncbi:MAG: hypothetical protein ACRD1G_19165 [Acidimicrobiales bacterium]